MSIKTKIEWADSTVNPVMGCTGCALRKEHCYAASLCTRYAGRKGWPKSFDNPELFPGRLEKAMRWRDLMGSARPDKPWLDGLPRHIFVNDLSDGFCPDVNPDEWLLPCLDSMGQSPHVWLLLTKWPGRMGEFFRQHSPPANVWGLVSVENQDQAWRIGKLLQCPFAVRGVSCEPLLGAIDLCFPEPLRGGEHLYLGTDSVIDKLDWIICGGESGPGARPMDPQWARDLRDQAQAAGVPYFHKQNGVWLPGSDALVAEGYGNPWQFVDDQVMFKVGRKRAGRLLNGRTWDEMPNGGSAQ